MIPKMTVADMNRWGTDHLPALIGIEVSELTAESLTSRLTVRPDLLAPNGFLHAASVIALADTTCGYGTMAFLPEGASSFTTLELKSNFTGTARSGTVICVARPQHRGRTTQLWDAVVTHEDSGKTIAHFRCTQLILWP